jgi:hypothetical protein
MMGKMTPYGTVPFFWTRHYDKAVSYVGTAYSWDTIHIDGEPRTNKFLALYIKDNKILAASGQQRSGDILTILEGMQQNEIPPADQLTADLKGGLESLRNKLRLTKNGGCKRANCCSKKTIVQ